MSPQEIHLCSSTPEAQAKRRLRLRTRRDDRLRLCDPLAERERVITYWKERAAAEPDKPQLGPGCFGWMWPIYGQPGFRPYVMPGVRAMLDAREKARRDKLAAEMRDYDQRCRERTALQNAEKARAAEPQQQLFTWTQAA